DRPSLRHDRLAHDRASALRAAPSRRSLRHRHDVYRRRTGNGRSVRSLLSRRTFEEGCLPTSRQESDARRKGVADRQAASSFRATTRAVDASRKVILVASASSPDRAIALERLLAAAATRSGWGERLEIRVGGIDSGAGRLSDAGTAALRQLGIDAEGSVCPDL